MENLNYFYKTSQTFVQIDDKTANVHYLTSVVQAKWGRDYVLVTNDCLPIEDCSGTQGVVNSFGVVSQLTAHH